MSVLLNFSRIPGILQVPPPSNPKHDSIPALDSTIGVGLGHLGPSSSGRGCVQFLKPGRNRRPHSHLRLVLASANRDASFWETGWRFAVILTELIYVGDNRLTSRRLLNEVVHVVQGRFSFMPT